MKKSSFLPCLAKLVLASLFLTQSAHVAQAGQTLKYTFDDITASPAVPNSAPGATQNGTLVTGVASALAPVIEQGGVVFVNGVGYNLGNVARFGNATGFDNGWAEGNAPHIATGASQGTFGINGNLPYTAMAWVKFENRASDNMVFGNSSSGGGFLHLGTRDGRYWSGHWGDDIEGPTTNLSDINNWHHMAWTNDSSNNQSIYLDGALILGPTTTGATGGLDVNAPLAIGTSGNGGGFFGSVDDVKVWNETLTPAQIAAERTSTLVLATPAVADPVVAYTFDNVVGSGGGTPVPNSGTLATAGTLVTGAGGQTPNIVQGPIVAVAGNFFDMKSVLNLGDASYNEGWSQADAPWLNTNFDQKTLGVTGTTYNTFHTYTMMAWVKWDATAPASGGDTMVFGNTASTHGFLHNGARNGQYHTGHWGDDVTGGTIDPTAWHHVTWVNQFDQQQSIYVDGVRIVGPGSNAIGDLDPDAILAVGTSGNGGGFHGQLDDVKIFNRQVDASQILAERSRTLAVPSDITMVSSVGTTVGDEFVVTMILKDAPGVGARAVVIAQITNVNFGAGAATSFTATKVGDLTTIVARKLGYIPGQNVYAMHVIGTDSLAGPYDVTQNVTGPIFPPVANITAPFSTDPAKPWGVREYSTSPANGTQAVGIVLTNAGPFVDANSAVINFVDADVPGVGGDFNNNMPFPGNSVGADDNHVIAGKIKITVAAAGPYTFNVHTDDGFGMKITGVPTTNIYGGSLVDPVDASAVINTGVADSRIVYNFPAAGTYDLLFTSFDSGGGGSAEISWALGTTDSNDERNLPWSLVGNPADPSVPAPTSAFPLNLPGLAGQNGKWGVRSYPTLGFENVNTLAEAMTFLVQPEVACWSATSGRAGVADLQASELNFKDPTSHPGQVGVVLGSKPVPGDTPADDDRVVTVARCRITVATAGEYTFNSHSDDGFLLRVKAVSGPNPFFRRVTGFGTRTMSAPNEMSYGIGGAVDTRGIMALAAGQYDLEYVHWEGVGGYFYQLTVAAGAFLDNFGANGTENWVPVGHAASSVALIQPTVESPWDVASSLPGNAGIAANFNTAAITAAEAALLPAITPLSALNFTDPQTNGLAPGRFGADANWPNDTGADDDNYSIKGSGYLHIVEEGLYIIGYEGDDGGYLTLDLPTGHPGFINLVENLTGAGVIESVSPDNRNKLRTEVGTGNSRTSALIYLTPDDYPITTLVYEGGGGSYWEVFGAAVGQSAITPSRAYSFTLLKHDPSYALDIANIPTFTPADTITGFTLSAQGSAPTFAGYSFKTNKNTPATVGLPKVLAKATDTDGGTLKVCGVATTSSQGGTVSATTSSFTYTPATGFTGTDTFSITIMDGQGGYVSGLVTVTVEAGTGISMNKAHLTLQGDGSVLIEFMGIPGQSYNIERSTDLLNWTTLATQTAAADGSLSYTDPTPPVGSAYYRTRVP
jgi:hypothetical protein